MAPYHKFTAPRDMAHMLVAKHGSVHAADRVAEHRERAAVRLKTFYFWASVRTNLEELRFPPARRNDMSNG